MEFIKILTVIVSVVLFLDSWKRTLNDSFFERVSEIFLIRTFKLGHLQRDLKRVTSENIEIYTIPSGLQVLPMGSILKLTN